MSSAAAYDSYDDSYRWYVDHVHEFDQPDGSHRGVHPADVALLDGPAVDALYGLRTIVDADPGQVPPGVMVQAILAAQRLAGWAKAQQHRWTAALARPGVAVPVASVVDAIAHRGDEPGSACDIPEELVERAAAGQRVVGDPAWDALVASEAAGFAEPELSAACTVSPITARRRIAEALELLDDLPDTFHALQDGRIDEVRARVIAETTRTLDPQLRGRAERLIVDRAKRGMTPGDLGRLAAKIVADLDPDAAATRAEQARSRRGTSVRNLGDDLARFTADVAAEDAALAEALLDGLARAVPADSRAGRGTSQLRADIFADLFAQLADTGLIDLRPTTHPNPTPNAADEPRPGRPAEVDTDPADADPRPADPGPADPAEADTPADPSPPTAAELLARLRSTDWDTWVDPGSARRGGLLSHTRLPAGLRINLDITVALSTLTGRDDLSARLGGLGVLTADTARTLAQAAGTVRLLTINDPAGPLPNGSPPGTGSVDALPRSLGGIHHDSPDCGTVLDFGRAVYRPPAAVADRVHTRDARCRFPGCAMPATRCDVDHRTPWDAGGATCPCNLDALCRHHHRIKTFTTWTAVRDHHTNTLTWTSPLGRVHTDQPAPDLPTGTPLNLDDVPPDAGPPAEAADNPGADDPPF